VMTKSPLHATDVHISIIGHITREELSRRLTDTDRANGFANRFLFVASRRHQLLPEDSKLDDKTCDELAERLRQSVKCARSVGEIKRDADARTLWHEIYQELSAGHSGLLGAVTSRAEAQVMRLGAVYALTDGSSVIRRAHLEAAYALWQYCDASAKHIFGQVSGDRLADEVLRNLKVAGSQGLTQTELNNVFSGHKSGEQIRGALLELAKAGKAISSSVKKTGGRPGQRWFALLSAEKAEKEEEDAVNTVSPLFPHIPQVMDWSRIYERDYS